MSPTATAHTPKIARESREMSLVTTARGLRIAALSARESDAIYIFFVYQIENLSVLYAACQTIWLLYARIAPQQR